MDPNDPQAGMTDGSYYISNDTWNAAGYQVSQSISVCNHANWWATASMNDSANDGAVKTYPNAHVDFNNVPLSSLGTITSTFAETSPHVGVYEDAYDIWLNGVASAGSTEVMIWTENYGQTPAGQNVGAVSIDGNFYTVWQDGGYIAFVVDTAFTSGTMNLSNFFDYIQAQGWIDGSATLGQIDYGAEIVSTLDTQQTFSFTNFSVTTNSTTLAGSRVGGDRTPSPLGPIVVILAGVVMWRVRGYALRRNRNRI